MSTQAPVALAPSELRNLLTATMANDYRAYVMFLIGVMHGLRVTEIINLRRRDFRKDGDTIFLTVQRLKGSEQTTQRLNTSDETLLDEHTVVAAYIARLDPDDLLFTDSDGHLLTRQTVSRLIEKYGRLAQVPQHKRHCHVLKHTAGTLMRQAGCDISVIQSALGHKNINSTAAYLRVSCEEVDVARQRAFAATGGE
jgi:integrase